MGWGEGDVGKATQGDSLKNWRTHKLKLFKTLKGWTHREVDQINLKTTTTKRSNSLKKGFLLSTTCVYFHKLHTWYYCTGRISTFSCRSRPDRAPCSFPFPNKPLGLLRWPGHFSLPFLLIVTLPSGNKVAFPS